MIFLLPSISSLDYKLIRGLTSLKLCVLRVKYLLFWLHSPAHHSTLSLCGSREQDEEWRTHRNLPKEDRKCKTNKHFTPIILNGGDEGVPWLPWIPTTGRARVTSHPRVVHPLTILPNIERVPVEQVEVYGPRLKLGPNQRGVSGRCVRVVWRHGRPVQRCVCRESRGEGRDKGWGTSVLHVKWVTRSQCCNFHDRLQGRKMMRTNNKNNCTASHHENLHWIYQLYIS